MNSGKLGFGFMRLPMAGEEVDLVRVCRLADTFLEHGFTYFDTAAPYLGGKSEPAFRECVALRHKRSEFQLADKLSQKMLKEGETPEQFFQNQLKHTGVKFFDRYLLHAMDQSKIYDAEDKGYWKFLVSLKREGLAKKIGFSFHDTVSVLESTLKEHPEVDFVQLQINYADWENPSVQSRKCLECARLHNKPVVVMEPVKGGLLANLPPAAAAKLKTVHSDWSTASWALCYAMNLPGVEMVLSGMSDEVQLEDNLSTAENLQPFSAEESSAMEAVKKILADTSLVPCTRCGYCLSQCPEGIPIPNLLAVLNNRRLFGDSPALRQSFQWYARNKKPSSCRRCGGCESVCPQHLEIIRHLRELSELEQ